MKGILKCAGYAPKMRWECGAIAESAPRLCWSASNMWMHAQSVLNHKYQSGDHFRSF